MVNIDWAETEHGWYAELPVDVAGGRNTAGALLRSVPESIPSGINDLALHLNDHVVVFAADDHANVEELLTDFVVAGIRDDHRNEHLSFELSEHHVVGEVRATVRRRLGEPIHRQLDIIEWARNRSDYEIERFTLDGMYRAMDQEEVRLRSDPDAVLRVASADCSQFMASLSNPRDYLVYEHRLAADLAWRLRGHGFLQLCTFKLPVLARVSQAHGISLFTAVAHLLAAHSRWVFVENGSVFVDHAAGVRLADVMQERHGIRWGYSPLRWLTAALAFRHRLARVGRRDAAIVRAVLPEERRGA